MIIRKTTTLHVPSRMWTSVMLFFYSIQSHVKEEKGDVRRGHSTYVTVGRVEEIFEGKAWDLMEKYHPTATAVCRLEEQFQKYDAFWDRLNKAKMMASSLHKTYDQQDHKIAVVRKSKRRERVRKTNRGEKEKKGTQQEEDAGTAEKKICKKGRFKEEQV